jgi:hypothetical protein
LEAFDGAVKNRLKAFLTPPDMGDVFKMPSPPEIPEQFWARGILGEIHQWHLKWNRITGCRHTPNGQGIDFVCDPGKFSVQTKTIQGTLEKTVGPGTISDMKNALLKLKEKASGDHRLVLEILHKPGVDITSLDAELNAFKQSAQFAGRQVEIIIEPFQFMTP